MVIQYQNRLSQIQHLVGEEGSISNVLFTNPTVYNVNNKEVQKVAEYLLPFSTGFEIECDKKKNFNIKDFLDIPYILDVIVDNAEQRFRIPKGLKGLQCLYNISLMLYKNSLVNPGSGIHYHIDCTSFFDKLKEQHLIDNKEGILQELDDWHYKGTYNSRRVDFGTAHTWIRRQTIFKTLECRIGEMTFDYKLLFYRITHLNSIIRDLKLYVEYEYDKEHNPKYLYDKNIFKVLKNRKEKI